MSWFRRNGLIPSLSTRLLELVSQNGLMILSKHCDRKHMCSLAIGSRQSAHTATINWGLLPGSYGISYFFAALRKAIVFLRERRGSTILSFRKNSIAGG